MKIIRTYRRVAMISLLSILFVVCALAVAYAASGDLLWSETYESGNSASESAVDVALDTRGNTYSTGSKGNDFLTFKYSSGGSFRWARTYDGPAGGTDRANAVFQRGRFVYVTGSSEGVGTGRDFATIKYGRSGAQLWVRRYDGPANGTDVAQAIAVADLNKIYVTGYSRRLGHGFDYMTIRYNSAGRRVWSRRYDGPARDKDMAAAIAADNRNDVYVTGSSRRSGRGQDYLTIKYGARGRRLWVRRYDGPAHRRDEATAIAVDSNNNVYVTGVSQKGGSGLDYLTIKYNAKGRRLWVRRYDGPAHRRDQAAAIAIDSDNNVIITGTSRGVGTDDDYATLKYSSAGVLQWVKRYDATGSDGGESANDVAVTGSKNVYVTGSSSDFTNIQQNCVTIKYSPNGVERWVKSDGGAIIGTSYSGDAIAARSSVYVAGSMLDRFNSDAIIMKYSP